MMNKHPHFQIKQIITLFRKARPLRASAFPGINSHVSQHQASAHVEPTETDVSLALALNPPSLPPSPELLVS